MKKLKFNSTLNHKQSDYQTREIIVEKVITLYGKGFSELKDHPLRDDPYIAENRDLMYIDDNDAAHCLLMVDYDSGDGILVESEIPQYQFASDDDIAKLYNFCKNIWESDEYVMARAKLECLMVIICGFKVSELIKLRIQDVSGSIINDKMKMVCCTSSKCIDTFLWIRADFTDLKLIKSDILFVSKYGKKNQQINLDYEMIRKQCGVSASVTLSSIRNSCVKECSILLDNYAVAAKLFDVAVRRLGMIKNHTVNSITDDEALLLEQYRNLTPTQKKELLKSITEK